MSPAAAAMHAAPAVSWHQTADTLELLAEHEADSTRAAAARADAETARRLARSLGLTHVEQAIAGATAQDAAELADHDADEAVAW